MVRGGVYVSYSQPFAHTLCDRAVKLPTLVGENGTGYAEISNYVLVYGVGDRTGSLVGGRSYYRVPSKPIRYYQRVFVSFGRLSERSDKINVHNVKRQEGKW